MDLATEQQRQKSKIRVGALTAGGLLAMVVGFVTYFLTPGVGPVIRTLLIAVAAAVLGYFAYRTSYNAGVAKAVCKNCGTAFAIREVERHEKLLGTEERRQVEQLKPATASEPGINRVTSWTEEKLEVTAIDECMNCHDRTERTWTMTRDKNKVEEEVAA